MAKKIPVLDGTVDGGIKFAAWVAREVAAGTMEARKGDVLLSAVSKVTSLIRAKHSQGELDEARAILAEIQEEKADMAHRSARARKDGVDIDEDWQN